MGFNPKRAALGACATAAASYIATNATMRIRRRHRAAPLVVFASSGAGSHVFPALAIASELQTHRVQAAFFGDSRGLEVHQVLQQGHVLYCVSSVELRRPMKSVANAIRALQFPLCIAHSAWVLVGTAPDVVVGLGGSTSVPTCVAACALGIPLLLYEPNAKPGSVTQALNVLARRTLLAYDSAAAGFRCKERCLVVGPAVRRDILDCAREGPVDARQRRRRKAREALGITARGARLLLVLGGPKGCGYLNCAVNNALPQLASLPGLHIMWQTGARQYVAYSAGHAASLPNVTCVPFVRDVGSALLAADLVLSRAGSSTVAELGAMGAPAVLVPSPAFSEEQQAANARVLADAGLAELLPQADVDEYGLAPRLLPLLAADGRQLASMRAAWAGAAESAATAGADWQHAASAKQAPRVAAGAVAADSGGSGCGEAVACIRDKIMQYVQRN